MSIKTCIVIFHTKNGVNVGEKDMHKLMGQKSILALAGREKLFVVDYRIFKGKQFLFVLF